MWMRLQWIKMDYMSLYIRDKIHTPQICNAPFLLYTHTYLIFDSLNGFKWNEILRLYSYILDVTAVATVSLSIFKPNLNTNDEWDLKLCWMGGKPHKYHKLWLLKL